MCIRDSAPTLQTSVTFGTAGVYDVFLSVGDIGQVDPEENLLNPTPLNFAFEGDDFTRWHANDGTFNGSPGYHDYEMSVGQITVASGETKNFLVDDVQDGTAVRSVYLGMRFSFVGAGTVEPSVPVETALGVAIDSSGTGQLVLLWASDSGVTFKLEVSENLTDWSTFAEGVSGDGGTASHSVPLADLGAGRYFRLR